MRLHLADDADANNDYRRVVLSHSDCDGGPVAVLVVINVYRSTENPVMRLVRRWRCGLFGHRWDGWDTVIVHGLFSNGRVCSRCRAMEWEAMS